MKLIAHAKRTDPDTAHQAASSLSATHLRKTQYEVLYAYRFSKGGMSHPDLISYMRASSNIAQSDSSIRSRSKELLDMGLIEDKGISPFRTSSGRKQHYFAITHAGRTAIAEWSQHGGDDA